MGSRTDVMTWGRELVVSREGAVLLDIERVGLLVLHNVFVVLEVGDTEL